MLPDEECERLPQFPYPPKFVERAVREVEKSQHGPGHHEEEMGDAAGTAKGRARKGAPKTAAATPHPMFVADMTAPNAPMPMPMPMPMNVGMPGPMAPLVQPSPEIARYLTTIDELAHAPQPVPHKDDLLHVPLFFHQMSGFRDTPVFQSSPLNAGGIYPSPVFSVGRNVLLHLRDPRRRHERHRQRRRRRRPEQQQSISSTSPSTRPA